MSVSCAQILEKFGITFIHGFEGFLVIESVGSLDVTAVYTAGHVGGEVESIAVEQIKERTIKRRPPTGRLPDLVVRNIDLNTLDVDCPGGQRNLRYQDQYHGGKYWRSTCRGPI